MKLILVPLISLGMLSANTPSKPIEKNVTDEKCLNLSSTGNGDQQPASDIRMSATAFKAQEYCRVELKDFIYDVQFKLVSATVYFANGPFKNTETREIKGFSLKPIKDLMDRCTPGTVVTFDNVKVIGPDNMVRVIDGKTIVLF
jgi:hypothetical protein